MGRLRSRRHHFLSALFRDVRRLDRRAVRARARHDQVQAAQALDFAGYPLVRTRAKFIRPTRFGDDVTVETPITFGRSSFDVAHRLSARRRAVRRMLGEAGLGGARPATGGIKSQPVPQEVLAKFDPELSSRASQRDRAKPARVSGRLVDLRRDLLQQLQEALAVARTDDAVEVALVPARAARQAVSVFCRPPSR